VPAGAGFVAGGVTVRRRAWQEASLAKRGKKAPVWVQATIVWFVTSGLATAGILYLRANETLSDRVFQPLAGVLCAAGSSLETSYGTTTTRRRDSSVTLNRRETVATLNSADCVEPSGTRRPTSLFIPVLWLVSAIPLGIVLALATRKKPRRT
jgi:hypothetical protein